MRPCPHRIVSHGDMRHSLAFFCEPKPAMAVVPHHRFWRLMPLEDQKELIEGNKADFPGAQTFKEILEAKFARKPKDNRVIWCQMIWNTRQ